jgi:hypothetical protein
MSCKGDCSGCDGSCLNVPAWQSETDALMLADMKQQLDAERLENDVLWHEIIEMRDIMAYLRATSWQRLKRWACRQWEAEI